MISDLWTGGVLKVDKRTLKFSKKLNPFNILHISDMHFSDNDTKIFDEFKNIVTKLKDEIDLVTWGGDLLSSDNGFAFLEKCKNCFPEIPVVCVLGNHDIHKDPVNYKTLTKKRFNIKRLFNFGHVHESNALRAKLNNIGVNLLEDKSMELNIKDNSIFIHGVKQPNFSVPHTRPAGLHLNEEQLNIILVHRPDMREKMVEGFDLLLGGHTHGGQIAFPFLGARVSNCGVSPKTVSGHYRVGNTQWLVNNGLSATPKTRIRYDCSRQISMLRVEEGISNDLKKVEFSDY